MDHVGFAYDASRCSGCMACVVACMDQNDFKAEGPSFRQVISYEKGQYPSAKITYFSLSCMHCGEVPCMNVCPTDAIGKAEDCAKQSSVFTSFRCLQDMVFAWFSGTP